MSDLADAMGVIDPAPLGAVQLGDGATAATVVVRPLKVGKLPAFARALQPLSADLEAMFAAGFTVAGVLKLVEERFEHVIEALEIATGAPRATIEDSTVEQALELVLAVLAANRDFLRGRLTAALQTAASLSRGAGQTPARP